MNPPALALSLALSLLFADADPPAGCVHLFPDASHLADALQLNAGYRDWLAANANHDPLFTARAGRLHDLYHALHEAATNHRRHQDYARQQLARARRLLGEAAFWRGRLPCPVPCELFQPWDAVEWERAVRELAGRQPVPRVAPRRAH